MYSEAAAKYTATLVTFVPAGLIWEVAFLGTMSLVPALAYIALAVLVLGSVLRALKYARAPMHLRWELYPVPHEKGRDYGGSYFEEVDWWKQPRETSLAGEIEAMLEEMLLIRSLWHHNRPQWFASFPFHFGLYMLITFVVLLAIEAGLQPALASAPALWWAVKGLTAAVGLVGLLLATLGSVLLLCRRAFDPVLKAASAFSDYFNLAFVLCVFAVVIWAWVSADPTFGLLRGYIGGLLSLKPVANVNPAISAEVAAVSAFMIYLPFTHMTHFVAKYFTYHQVRWDDRPNLNEAQQQAKILANLKRPVGWSAPHIQSDKSWAEAATEVK